MRIELSDDYKRCAKHFRKYEGLYGSGFERILDKKFRKLLPHERRYLIASTELGRSGSEEAREELRVLAKAELGSISLYAGLYDIAEEDFPTEG
jgi:hypothetical protein